MGNWRTASLVSVIALVGGLGPLSPPATASPAAAPCAPLDKTIGGSFLGDQGYLLSGMVGVVLVDAEGRYLDAEGCPGDGDYSVVDLVNVDEASGTPTVGPSGVPPGLTDDEDRWEIAGIPANAARMLVEAYPVVDENRFQDPYMDYGGAMRRWVPADVDSDLRLPARCNAVWSDGGDASTITGSVRRAGQPVEVVQVTAWSLGPESWIPLGFVAKAQTGQPTGAFTVPNLARDQRYALHFLLVDGSEHWYDDGSGIPVTTCSTTTTTFDLRGDGSADLTGMTRSTPPDGVRGPPAPAPLTRITQDVSGTYQPIRGDFRGLGHEDVLWFSAFGPDRMWRSMGDGQFFEEAIDAAGVLTPLVGDFDGDGHDDIYWFSPTGGDALYRGTDAGFTATYPNSNGDYTGHVGDYDGDGRDDIYWFSTHGGDAIYYGTPTGFSAVYPNANGVYTAHPGDFNGDGRDDIYWFSPTAGDAIYYGQAVGFTATYPNANGDFKVLVGDYDADDIDDIYWFSTWGGDALYHGNPSGFTAIYPNADGPFTPVVADIDAATGDDLLWFAPGFAGDVLWMSTGSRGTPFAAGPPVEINGTSSPITGAFDTGPATDVIWYDPSYPEAIWVG